MLYKWTTKDYPEDLQFEAWKTLISNTAYELSFDKPETPKFHSEHSAFKLNGLALRRGVVDPFACERTTREVRRSDEPFYALQGTTVGRQFVDYPEFNAILEPGNGYIWDSEHTGKLIVPEPMEMFSMVIPKHILDSKLAHRSGIQISFTNSSIKNLLFSTIATTLTNANSFDKSQLQSIEDVILSLTVAAFSHPGDDAQLTYQAAKLDRIKDHIQRRIEDPNLSPAQVASALGISLRGLHMAFSESSDTFGSYLQNARIKQAALDLRQNPKGFQSITEIAYKHGFSSSSQFSRVFKRYLQLTPREYKKTHS